MAIPVKWTLCLLLLLPFQTVADDSEVMCEAEAKSCSQCYAALVKHVLTNDTNQFNIQNTFFPPDKASPAFVTIFYEYYEDDETSANTTEIWYWSTSTFYIYHPLTVFQFTSLLFSDISKQISELTLKLDLACMDASLEFKRLLTQRLKVYATEQSISSPISADYEPKVETAETIKQWHKDHTKESNYIPSTFYVFPILAMLFIFFAVYYYNESKENNRMSTIKNILDPTSTDYYGQRAMKHELQNEYVVSLIFTAHVLILSIFGVHTTLNIDKYLNEHIKDYFGIYNLNTSLEHSSSLAITTLTLDLMVVVLMHVVVLMLVGIKSVKDNVDNISHWKAFKKLVRIEVLTDEDKTGLLSLCAWRYCTYSVLFPFCLIVNHLNYIVIAFIHDVYHATGVAIIYGVVISILFGVLMQLSYWIDKCKFKETTDKELQNFNQQDFDANKQQNTPGTLFGILVFKILAGFFLVGCLLFDVLLYYVLPINNAFDDATNHLITLYQTTALFFAAIAAYFFLKNRNRSPIGILTQAEIKGGIMGGDRRMIWGTLTDDQRDLEMAKDILGLLRDMKARYAPQPVAPQQVAQQQVAPQQVAQQQVAPQQVAQQQVAPQQVAQQQVAPQQVAQQQVAPQQVAQQQVAPQQVAQQQVAPQQVAQHENMGPEN